MRSYLTDITRNFLDGRVSVESLRVAAQAETVDRVRANKILVLLSQSANNTWSTSELRERTRNLM